MDKIILKNLAFYAYHGALKEENTLGQKFFIDLDLYAPLKKAGESDHVKDTIHYGQVYERVKALVEKTSYQLIESLAENICKDLFEHFQLIEEIRILVKKPQAPVQGIFDYMGVELRRKRNE